LINDANVMDARHQAVNGMGSTFNYLSDANADSVWTIGANESPLGNNSVYNYEFVFPNGLNVLAGSTGLGFPDWFGGANATAASRGLYNGFGFVSGEGGMSWIGGRYPCDNSPLSIRGVMTML
jgi:hypothetical protein